MVKYNEVTKKWMVAGEKVELGVWVNCDKHETSTSVTPVYPPSGGGSTIKPGSNGSNQGDGAVVNPDNNQGDNKDKVDTGNKQTGKIKNGEGSKDRRQHWHDNLACSSASQRRRTVWHSCFRSKA